MSDSLQFTVGCQAEVVRRYKPAYASEFEDVDAFAENLATRYGEMVDPIDPEMFSSSKAQEVSNKGAKWMIVEDLSIDYDEERAEWPMEFVSPVMSHGDNWQRVIKRHFTKINKLCYLTINPSCAFHVHIRPIGGWTLLYLLSLCHAILYFENAVQALLPPERRGNFWARSNNWDNSRLRTTSIQQIENLLQNCHNTADIASLMNDGQVRFYAWNFQNLLGGGTDTVEFRSPPAADRAAKCIPWVEFVASFVTAALTTNRGQRQTYQRNLRGLKRFIKDNAPNADGAILSKLFAGRHNSASHVPQQLGNPTQEIRDKLAEKMAQTTRNNALMVAKFS